MTNTNDEFETHDLFPVVAAPADTLDAETLAEIEAAHEAEGASIEAMFDDIISEDSAETPIIEDVEPPSDHPEEPQPERLENVDITSEPTVEPRVEETPAIPAHLEAAADAPAGEPAEPDTEAPPGAASTPQRLDSNQQQLIDEYRQGRKQVHARDRQDRKQFKARRKEIRRLKANNKRRAWAAERWPPEERAAKKKQQSAERSRQYRERKKLAGSSAGSDYA